MHIVLLIYSMSHPGGAERVLSIMANYWAKQGWNITLMTLDDGHKPPFYKMHPDVRLRPLSIAKKSTHTPKAILNNIKRLRVLRHTIVQSQPDAVIAFMSKTNILTLLATLGLKMPIIVSERNDPARLPLGAVWKFLRNWIYPRAAAVVVQSQAAMDFFSSRWQQNMTIIPNPIPDRNGLPCDSGAKTGSQLVAMGSLTEQKGFDLLLQAFAEVAPRFPDWTLTIWGEGSLRSKLESFRDELGLKNKVQLPGLTEMPFKVLSQADVFVLSSRYEGFPNALCEAMVCGLPVISFDCPSGPKDIIRDGIDGVLVPAGDVAALAAVLDRLMSDETERKRLAKRAPEITERFSVERVMRMWESLFYKVIND